MICASLVCNLMCVGPHRYYLIDDTSFRSVEKMRDGASSQRSLIRRLIFHMDQIALRAAQGSVTTRPARSRRTTMDCNLRQRQV